MMMDQITGDVVRKLFAIQLSQDSGHSAESLEELEHEFLESAPKLADIQYNLAPDGSLIPASVGTPPPSSEASASPLSALGVAGSPSVMSAPSPLAQRIPLGGKTPAPGSLILKHGAQPIPPQNTAGSEISRNDPCPCGSGKKYKKCHGSAQA